jgi:hypothetical protein
MMDRLGKEGVAYGGTPLQNFARMRILVPGYVSQILA